ncbi:MULTISPECIES: glutamine synthetase family protein [Acidianus]|uniref:Glutamine synthetase n=1 Tax=Candidatus Acidianus copahuensis TaxID=1160895 RepID=A0A031LSQ4_9CREN|nr:MULTISPECIES: glutamine synthetase family protein [Acidianus]EZQ10851.1 glutamine synthetase [Candidatus Acidianus copahuensis]NON61240.1 glutamine synthetase [Acidianus sp. RZ1]
MSKDELLEALKSGRIDYIRVEFIDLLGNVRGRSLRRAEFETITQRDSGISYPESLALLDYKDQPIKDKYEDILAIPDPSTFVAIPYLERTARVLSFLFYPDFTPSPYCSRGILRKAIHKLEEKGYSLQIALEPTFYLIKENEEKLLPADESRAFSPEGLMEEQNFLKDLIKDLESVGIQVKTINKHYGPAQYEIGFEEKEALSAADSLTTSREIIRDVARIYNMYATFMPKPFSDMPGSSMDVYFKLLRKDEKETMTDPNDPKGYGISRVAYSFVAGILDHLGGIMAFASPTINSYKRFREIITPALGGMGSERHFVVRIPSNFREIKSLEFRLADPLANSYLMLSSIIFAGIDGIEKDLDQEIDVATVNIPKSLQESLKRLDEDNVLKFSLGTDLVSAFIDLKKREIESYESYVSDWEVSSYLKAGW